MRELQPLGSNYIFVGVLAIHEDEVSLCDQKVPSFCIRLDYPPEDFGDVSLVKVNLTGLPLTAHITGLDLCLGLFVCETITLYRCRLCFCGSGILQCCRVQRKSSERE
jgi:hypothetical protein